MKQSQRKPVKPQEAHNKRECNHPEQHKQERGEEKRPPKNRTTEESEAFWQFILPCFFFQGCRQVDKTANKKQIMSFSQKPH